MKDAVQDTKEIKENQSDDSASTPQKMQTKRKKLLTFFALFVLVLAIIYGIWLLFFNNSVSTDNAYVNADNAQITSMVDGQVSNVLVKNTQQVKKGDILVELDQRDAQIELAEAEANLAKAKRQYKQSFANSESLNSQITVRTDEINSAKAQVNKAQNDVDKATQDLQRRLSLAASGAISKEELTSAQSTLKTAQANLGVAQAGLAQAQSNHKAAQSNLAANDALISNSNESSVPDVLVAQAKVDQAKLDLERNVIRAPIDGVVAKRNVQTGQRLAPGSVVMTIVPLSQLYVDANFKESQLGKVKVGQTATLTSDLYGSGVEYHGKVVGFSGGTGAAFALIPAQNATGNWIKVVQRLPVRIELDPKELAEHPLRVGLSMEATIDLKSKN